MPLTRAEQQRGMRLAYLCQAVGINLEMTILSSAVFPLFIKFLGGSDFQAMLPAILSGVLLLARLPLSLWVPPHRWRGVWLGFLAVSSVPMLVGLLGVAWLGPSPSAVHLLLAAALLCLACLYGGSVFWFPLLHDVIPDDWRGRFFGNMRALYSLVYFALSLLMGSFLGNQPPLWKFVAVMLWVTLLQMVREPLAARIPVTPPPPRQTDWRDDLSFVVRHRPTQLFCAYFLLLSFLTGFLTQPLVLYMDHLGFSARDNTMIYATSLIGSVLALYVGGQWVDRVGTRRVFVCVHGVMCGLALGACAVGALPAAGAKPTMIGLQIASGATLAIAGLAYTAQLFHLAPVRARALYMNLTFGVIYAGSTLAPFVTGALLDSGWRTAHLRLGQQSMDVFQLLFAAVALGLVITLYLVRFVSDVRAPPVASAPGAKG